MGYRPLTENESIAQHVCKELSNIQDENRNEIIKISAQKIITEIKTEGNIKLVNALQNELQQCYPKLFPKEELITA